MQNSYVELNGRERAQALLDRDTFRELVGPFDRLYSPHLEPQGIVPQSDDGVIVARGMLQGEQVLVISIEGAFQGGGIGEVGGAKISGALELALEANIQGDRIVPILLLDTGGVRLQEANYGLLSISEISSQVIALREHVPVIGVIPGRIGAFGGMSIVAELASTLIATRMARLGLNGPEVIEQEAGVMEFDSRDKELIWNTIGARQRQATGLIDELVEDDATALTAAIYQAMKRPAKAPKTLQTDFYLSLLSQFDPAQKWTPENYVELYEKVNPINQFSSFAKEGPSDQANSRGYRWFAALTGMAHPVSDTPSVLAADIVKDGQICRYISVVPDAASRYPRAKDGEVGLLEGWTVAQLVRDAIRLDQDSANKRPIIAIVDVPSQAYGYSEELIGISLALAASTDAYACARMQGHPVVALIVGNAISGAFLAHGLQANRLIALDDPGVHIQAMSKTSAARITRRSISELEEATSKVPAMAYDITSYSTLGSLFRLLQDIQADAPRTEDLRAVEFAIAEAIASIETAPLDLISSRLQSEAAQNGGRAATLRVREALRQQW
ncbi:biotin-independent malonate decarboxylase subunit beta [Paenibacillus antibioticophila]|uniref:biotin-independent malonate decarboxylase subunit beta n=1 Tax=Paenibacillus antibioticophila TaxID=1274374 RepID=UPI0005C9C1E2|nr:biotin-independent malonate decarboxylase subunit beta [Paenibacillus antibioticophila]